MKVPVIILSIVLNVNTIKFQKKVIVPPVFRALPCGEDQNIISFFQEGLKYGYNVSIQKNLEPATDIKLKFDSQSAIFFDKTARFSNDQDDINNIISIILLKSSANFTFNVRGQAIPFAPPYLTSLQINGDEFCTRPNMTYFRDFPVGVLSHADRSCGRRKIFHTQLIVHGVNTKAGDWPWHAAVLKHNGTSYKYACGGTLISKYFILTAAHCATIRGIAVTPDILSIHLGKYYLFQSSNPVQEKAVFSIFVHDEYRHRSLNNDIALLQLKTEAVFNNYIQPICLWNNNIVYDKLTFNTVGTVVGWGFDQHDALALELQAAHLPVIPKLDCIYSKPEFYANILRDNKKFCAGYTNGTTVCNGDSGGGYVFFVPDSPELAKEKPFSSTPGAYYVKGIVSNTLSRADFAICDPNAYAIFTDVAIYLPWIHSIIDDT